MVASQDEELPTLSEDDGVHDGVPLLGHESANDTKPTPNKEAKPLSTLVLYFMCIHFLLAFCEIILIAPLIKLFEESLCRSYYDFPAHGIEEAACKIEEIQGPLATIRGWKSMFDTIPVLLVAIPLGKFGDNYGRKRIMSLALIGVSASLCEIFVVSALPEVFPLRLVWLSSVFLLCGGGLNAASAFMWAMASESIPSEQRSHAFYYIFSAFYVAELISSFIAFITIEISPWIPCGLAMGSIILCLLVVWLMPNVPGSNKSVESDPHAQCLASTIENENLDHIPDSLTKYPMVDGLLGALSNPNVLKTIPVFVVGTLRYPTLNVLIQYASVRFSLEISKGARFYSDAAIVNIILFLFLVPRLTALLRMKYSIRPEVIDLFLVRTSIALLCVGSLSIGLATSRKFLPIGVCIFAAGFGSRVSALSLVSYWISEDAKATSYAAIVVLESLGHAIGDPSIQQIFAASLRLPIVWLAMPFFVAAGLYFLAGLSTAFIRIENKSRDIQDIPTQNQIHDAVP